MQLTSKQKAEMLEIAKPLLKWLNDNCHPHCRITVDSDTAELIESQAVEKCPDFLRD